LNIGLISLNFRSILDEKLNKDKLKMNLTRSFGSVSIWTAVSRVFGFVRDLIIATFLGAGRASDIFFAAWKIPNMFRNILGEGALQVSFVPMFLEKKKNERSATDFANMAISWLLAVSLGITIIAEIAMPLIMLVLAPGFSAEPGKLDSAIALGRVLFPYMILICCVGFLSGILNSKGKFALTASMPVVLNIFMIMGAMAAWKFNWSVAYGLSVAVIIAGVFQVALLWRRIQAKNFGLRLVRPRINADIKTLGRRIVPGIIGSGAYQINILIGTIIASLTPGAVSWLYYADRMVQLPFAIIGLAVGTVLLTSISTALADGDHIRVLAQQNKSIRHILFWTMPAFAGLVALAEPIIRVLFQRGEFTAFATQQTSVAIMILAFSLPAMSLAQVFSTTLYASKDTKTPVKISINSILIGTVISVAMFPLIGFLSVALGTVVSSWLRVILMGRVCYKRKMFAIQGRTVWAFVLYGGLAAAMFAALRFANIGGLIDLCVWIGAVGVGYLICAKLVQRKVR
jgi:putative peptidoglycan lipid II flippase